MIVMVLLTIVAFFGGIGCARRWNMFILPFASIAAWLCVISAGVAFGQSALVIFFEVCATHIALQAGYFFGLMLFDWMDEVAKRGTESRARGR